MKHSSVRYPSHLIVAVWKVVLLQLHGILWSLWVYCVCKQALPYCLQDLHVRAEHCLRCVLYESSCVLACLRSDASMHCWLLDLPPCDTPFAAAIAVVGDCVTPACLFWCLGSTLQCAVGSGNSGMRLLSNVFVKHFCCVIHTVFVAGRLSCHQQQRIVEAWHSIQWAYRQPHQLCVETMRMLVKQSMHAMQPGL